MRKDLLPGFCLLVLAAFAAAAFLVWLGPPADAFATHRAHPQRSAPHFGLCAARAPDAGYGPCVTSTGYVTWEP